MSITDGAFCVSYKIMNQSDMNWKEQNYMEITCFQMTARQKAKQKVSIDIHIERKKRDRYFCKKREEKKETKYR